MAFLETPRFPTSVSLGALSKPRYKTSVIPLASGYRARNIEWAQGLHSFDFTQNALLPAAHEELLKFFHALQGAGHQFRVKDHADFKCIAADGVFIPLHGSGGTTTVGTVGVGYGAKVYLAAKKYTAGALTTVRWLQKLVSGTVVVRRNGSAVTLGAAPGNIALSTTTGKITFVADQTRNVNSHVAGATAEFTFASAFSPNFTVGERVYFDGIVGTAASVLDHLSHEVTFVSGSTIRVNTNTTGLTVTAGTAYRYPQASDTLTLSCEFDVPCVFSGDEATFEIFDVAVGNRKLYRWSGINIEEDRIPL